MHASYGFVYFHQSGGSDPFLTLKFANQGESLRRTLRSYAFESVPDFPHQAFKRAAQSLIDRRHVWMPEGRTLCALTDVP
ncbi:hypothetical protein HNR56_003807 [Roseospira marina]|nr:hypothetical protein [Roseospira marina]MBB5089092.1 hypothetical protein [Roseospira marina]